MLSHLACILLSVNWLGVALNPVCFMNREQYCHGSQALKEKPGWGEPAAWGPLEGHQLVILCCAVLFAVALPCSAPIRKTVTSFSSVRSLRPSRFSVPPFVEEMAVASTVFRLAAASLSSHRGCGDREALGDC